MPIKGEVAAQLTGRWKHQMFEAPCEAPVQCLYGCLCTCCAVYQQREELLKITGEPYICCAGLCPCGPLGEPQDKNCLVIEACCCTGWALSANRYMIQTRFDRENTPCDDCIIWGTCLFICGLNIARCFMDIPDELDFCADCLIMTVNGCMHAQQHIEIQEIKNTGYQGPPAQLIHLLPPLQQKMITGGYGGGGAQPQMMGGGPPPPQYNMQQQQPYGGGGQQAHGGGGGPPQMQQGRGVQVQCGTCRQVFGSPQTGVTVACPHCGTHNAV
mmetsp:Transcript_3791/g.14053  ORF Transcript_3791/g.14053 Transcript_3791/m.14053 type:complete len:271 (-) Transcript_3791:287-1099(-)